MSTSKQRRVRIRVVVGAGLGVAIGHVVDAAPLIALDTGYRVWFVAVFAVVALVVRMPGGGIWKLFQIKWSAIYMFRAPHPNSLWRQKVCVYVGQTTRKPTVRRNEHLYGSSYGEPAKPWSDTVEDPDRDFILIHPWKRRPMLLVNFLEWANIKVRLPLYNGSMNWTNPRRIPKAKQLRQRAQRDMQLRTVR